MSNILVDNRKVLQKGIEKKNKQLRRLAKLTAYKNRKLLRKTLKKGHKEVRIRPLSTYSFTLREAEYVSAEIGRLLTQKPENYGWNYRRAFGTCIEFYYEEKDIWR